MKLVRNTYGLICCIVILAALSGSLSADESTQPKSENRIKVLVGVPPIAYLVERIGGRHVEVQTLMQASQDPHHFEPTPRQIASLMQSEMFIHVGLPFEREFGKRLQQSNKNLRMINLARELIGEPSDSDHRNHNHQLSATDPHIWLSPVNLETLANQIFKQLMPLFDNDPTRAEITQNHLGLVTDIRHTDKKIATRLQAYRGKTFVAYHGAFEHFALAFGLKQQAIEAEGKSPSPRHLAKIVKQSNGARVILSQPQFDPRAAQTIAQAISAKVVLVNPMAYDVLVNLEELAKAIEQNWATE